jgi:hypothetical protein
MSGGGHATKHANDRYRENPCHQPETVIRLSRREAQDVFALLERPPKASLRPKKAGKACAKR